MKWVCFIGGMGWTILGFMDLILRSGETAGIEISLGGVLLIFAKHFAEHKARNG